MASSFKVPEYFIIHTAPPNEGANTPGPGRLSVRPGRLSVRPVYYHLHFLPKTLVDFHFDCKL